MVRQIADTPRECCARAMRACVVAMAVLLVAAILVPGAALADRTFAPRFTTTDRGQVVMAGNTVMTCPTSASGCAAARAGTSSDDNGDFDMAYTDVDSES